MVSKLLFTKMLNRTHFQVSNIGNAITTDAFTITKHSVVLGTVTKHFCLCKIPHSKLGATYQQSARIRQDLLKASFYRTGLDEDMYSDEMQ